MRVTKNFIVKVFFEGGMFVGSFIVALLALMFLMLSYSLRLAFGQVLRDMLDTMVKNKVILELATNVRWKKDE